MARQAEKKEASRKESSEYPESYVYKLWPLKEIFAKLEQKDDPPGGKPSGQNK